MQQLIQLKNQEQVQDDDVVDKGNIKKEFSTNGTTLPTTNGKHVADNMGQYTFITGSNMKHHCPWWSSGL
jgi:hypothetical protein